MATITIRARAIARAGRPKYISVLQQLDQAIVNRPDLHISYTFDVVPVQMDDGVDTAVGLVVTADTIPAAVQTVIDKYNLDFDPTG